MRVWGQVGIMEVVVAGCGRERAGQGDRAELGGRTDTQTDRRVSLVARHSHRVALGTRGR